FRGATGGSGGSSNNQFTTSVSVDQLLFDFGRTRDSVRQQQSLERASLYNLAEDLANVTIGEGNVANRQRQLDQAQARLNSGLGAPADVVQAKTNLADAAISLSSARNTALTSQITLAQ